jgi:predicted aldo/keto reductase-like oxidoreductase
MSHDDRIDIDRRRFLEAGLGVAAAAGLGGALTARPSEAAVLGDGALPMNVLGKTGRRLPILGCGGAAIAPRLAPMFSVPPLPFENRVALIRQAYDAGIRYFDTARGYQESEAVYGRALEGVRREVYLATKVHASSPDAVRPSIETSLSELKTDVIDCIQIHGQRLELNEAMAVHAELVKLKEEGLVRFIGLTGHDHFDRMYAKIDTGAFDQVLLAYGYFRKGMGNILTHEDLEWRELCMTRAHELGMGIVSMKVMGAWVLGHASKKVVPGHDPEALAKLPGAAIRWALRDPRVHILNIGVSILGDVDKNIAVLRGDPTFTEADRTVLAEFSTKAYDSEFLKKIQQAIEAAFRSG